MSAAFTLDFSGPETPCDFPGCVLSSFHEGEHEFLSQRELNERAAAAVTSYGVGTRSYNRSAEKREMDRQRKEATARYLAERAKHSSEPKTQLEQAQEKIAKAELSDAHSVSLSRGEWTALWMADSRNHGEIAVPVTCPCAQRPYPHELAVHKRIGSEKPGTYSTGHGDTVVSIVRFQPEGLRWPWSLKYAPNMEAPQ
jgi:hypothetical protein